jgi:antirestriction protein ArdC
VMLWSAAVTKGYACPLWLTYKQAIAPLVAVALSRPGATVVTSNLMLG